MLSKKSIKIISAILLAVVLLMSIGSVVLAADPANDFQPDTSKVDGKAGTLAKTILGVIQWAGIGIAVGMLIFLGIKYVTSSPDGKANLKGQLGIYILGLVLILAAVTIVNIIGNAITNGLGQ